MGVSSNADILFLYQRRTLRRPAAFIPQMKGFSPFLYFLWAMLALMMQVYDKPTFPIVILVLPQFKR